MFSVVVPVPLHGPHVTTCTSRPRPPQLLASGVQGAISEYSLKPVSGESPPAPTQTLLLNLSM